MSIQRILRKKGFVYKVWWREGHRMRSRTFDRKRDAQAFEGQLRVMKRRGDLAELDAGRITLNEFVDDWRALHADPFLAPKTKQLYEWLLQRHILPRLGHLELRQPKTETIRRFTRDLLESEAGAVTTQKALALLGGILQRAVEFGHLSMNPARLVPKPSRPQRRAVHPLPPEKIEALRGHMLGEGQLQDATIISVLAYAGLRPGEAMALTWGDVRERTLLVERSVSLGEVRATKTRRTRSVDLLKPLAQDLAGWRMACGRPNAKALIFSDSRGGPLNLDNWRRRVYRPAAEAIGLETTAPYDLRHSFCSLLLAEGRSPLEVAEQLGHSPVMTLSTYGHVIRELKGQKHHLSAESLIRQARARECSPIAHPH